MAITRRTLRPQSNLHIITPTPTDGVSGPMEIQRDICGLCGDIMLMIEAARWVVWENHHRKNTLPALKDLQDISKEHPEQEEIVYAPEEWVIDWVRDNAGEYVAQCFQEGKINLADGRYWRPVDYRSQLMVAGAKGQDVFQEWQLTDRLRMMVEQ